MKSFFEHRRICLCGFAALAFSLAGCGVTLAPPGFVREHPHSVCRGWFDWNSHRRFSFTLDTYDRLPPHSARVKLFRWSHGASVESPREIIYATEAISSEEVIAPEIPGASIPIAPPAEDATGTHPASEDAIEWSPPPAPPSEKEVLDLPLPTDPAEDPGENSSEADGKEPPSLPAVSISFAEPLNEAPIENPPNSAACSVPFETILPPE